MKEFDISIKETLEMTVTVEAESREEAEEKVQQAYNNSEYILDSENFTGVDFSVQEERELAQNKLDVLLIKPGMYPQQVQIGSSLESLQAAVGGDIQATYPFEDMVALVMDEEGKLKGNEANRALRTDDGDIYDIVVGDFLVVGLSEDDFCSLTPEQTEKFDKLFHQPEMFVQMGRGIMALPLPEEHIRKQDDIEKAANAAKKATPDRMEL